MIHTSLQTAKELREAFCLVTVSRFSHLSRRTTRKSGLAFLDQCHGQHATRGNVRIWLFLAPAIPDVYSPLSASARASMHSQALELTP